MRLADVVSSSRRLRRLVSLAAVASLMVMVASAGAQAFLRALDTANPQSSAEFGDSVAVGDVNGDGKGDVAIGADWENTGRGRVYIFSGGNGALLRTLQSPNPQVNALFGGSVAMGDVNGDGKADVAVGAYWEDVDSTTNAGRVYVFSGADGTLLWTLSSPNTAASEGFGFSVAMGDVNHDGKQDIAVGAGWEDVGGNVDQGRAYVFSGSDGSLLFTLDTPNPQVSAQFGSFVAVGDADADGRADIAVAESGGVRVFSGATGDVMHSLAATGVPRVAMGDVNGDGKADIAVADTGHVFVFSGATGSLWRTINAIGVPAVGDVYQDGKADIVVGAFTENVGGYPGQGRVYLFSGIDGSLLLTLDNPDLQPNTVNFGMAVAVGDVNGDGRREIAAGAPNEDVSFVDQGRAYVFSGPQPPVGGIAEHPQLEPEAATHARSSSAAAVFGLLGIAAAGALLVVAGWYARRRWLH